MGSLKNKKSSDKHSKNCSDLGKKAAIDYLKNEVDKTMFYWKDATKEELEKDLIPAYADLAY